MLTNRKPKIGNLVWSVSLLAAFAVCAPNSYAKVEVKRNSGVEAKREREVVGKKNANIRGNSQLLQIANTLNIEAKDLQAFFRSQKKAGAESKEALAKLVNLALDKNANPTDISIVSNYLRVRTKSADNFHIREADLHDIVQSWPANNKANFAAVLERTAELVAGKKFATIEEAFEQALKEKGFLEKYRSCKI